ncbi:hypothetical protein AFLA70_314g001141 [Aspergillus flavus AF70]|nr:hypothetical protein AFLA70_314g001141 [Aspergillus flavus AF70]
MTTGTLLKGVRRTLSTMKRPRNIPFDEKGGSTNQDGRGTIPNTPTQQSGGQNQGVEACSLKRQTTARRDNHSCANSEVQVPTISALYRSELEDSSDDTNIAGGEEVEYIRMQLKYQRCGDTWGLAGGS